LPSSADKSSAPPSGPNPDGKAGSIALVTDGDPVQYRAGETPFKGTASLGGAGRGRLHPRGRRRFDP
jgi:hypothetical protein